MGRARKGCKFCDVRRKDWDWPRIPVNFGEFGALVFNVWVRGYRKQLVIELEPENREPIWDAQVDIEYCPFCGTNLKALEREV